LSPLKKTEQQPASAAAAPRTRTKSGRQLPESEFIKKVNDVPVVHNTMEYILSTYGVIKDVNPLVKTSLERSEDVAFWIREKAGDVVTATKMDEQLKRLDSAAAQGMTSVEQTGSNIRQKLNETSKDVKERMERTQEKLKDEGLKMQKRTSDASATFFGGVQTIVDNVEERCKPVMAKKEEGGKEEDKEPSMTKTVGRTVDVAYRLNLGIIQYSTETAKKVVDPEAVGTFLRKNFSPSHIRVRVGIVRQAVTESGEKQVRYMDDKELTELDRRLISLAHRLTGTGQAAIETAKEAPAKITGAVQGSVKYVGGVVKHFSEARSLTDLAGIGLNESRIAMEGARNNLPFVNNFGILDGAIDWTASKEKSLSQ